MPYEICSEAKFSVLTMVHLADGLDCHVSNAVPEFEDVVVVPC